MAQPAATIYLLRRFVDTRPGSVADIPARHSCPRCRQLMLTAPAWLDLTLILRRSQVNGRFSLTRAVSGAATIPRTSVYHLANDRPDPDPRSLLALPCFLLVSRRLTPSSAFAFYAFTCARVKVTIRFVALRSPFCFGSRVLRLRVYRILVGLRCCWWRFSGAARTSVLSPWVGMQQRQTLDKHQAGSRRASCSANAAYVLPRAVRTRRDSFASRQQQPPASRREPAREPPFLPRYSHLPFYIRRTAPHPRFGCYRGARAATAAWRAIVWRVARCWTNRAAHFSQRRWRAHSSSATLPTNTRFLLRHSPA